VGVKGLPSRLIKDFELCSEIQESDKEKYSFLIADTRAQSFPWLLSRVALARLLERQGEPSELAQTLSFPNPRYSLSHKKGLAIAVLAGASASRGVGVDLEPLKVLDATKLARFIPAREAKLFQAAASKDPYLPLKLWVLKEALFKSDPENAGRFLSDYDLRATSLQRGTLAKFGLQFRYELHQLGKYFLGIALSRLPAKVPRRHAPRPKSGTQKKASKSGARAGKPGARRKAHRR
jgi:hypothetical protein